jgi:hypothetical protein
VGTHARAHTSSLQYNRTRSHLRCADRREWHSRGRCAHDGHRSHHQCNHCRMYVCAHVRSHMCAVLTHDPASAMYIERRRVYGVLGVIRYDATAVRAHTTAQIGRRSVLDCGGWPQTGVHLARSYHLAYDTRRVHTIRTHTTASYRAGGACMRAQMFACSLMCSCNGIVNSPEWPSMCSALRTTTSVTRTI